MPELPEVEAVVRKVRSEATGARIRAVEVIRARTTHPQSPDALQTAANRTITAIERKGKNIVLRLSGGHAIRVHLRMTGNLYVIPDARLRPATARVVFTLAGGRALVFDDPRVLGTVHLHTNEEIDTKLADIGIDPLERRFTPQFLTDAAARSRRPVKLFLMDQYPVAGIGNIYAAESLFRARIHPQRPVNTLRAPQIAALHSAIRAVINEAVKLNVKAYREPGYFEEIQFAVFGREGEACMACGRAIQRIAQGGRSTYFCVRCQRPPQAR